MHKWLYIGNSPTCFCIFFNRNIASLDMYNLGEISSNLVTLVGVRTADGHGRRGGVADRVEDPAADLGAHCERQRRRGSRWGRHAAGNLENFFPF
jgi:hypothetical protein